jgi:hypothetical protein
MTKRSQFNFHGLNYELDQAIDTNGRHVLRKSPTPMRANSASQMQSGTDRLPNGENEAESASRGLPMSSVKQIEANRRTALYFPCCYVAKQAIRSPNRHLKSVKSNPHFSNRGLRVEILQSVSF